MDLLRHTHTSIFFLKADKHFVDESISLCYRTTMNALFGNYYLSVFLEDIRRFIETDSKITEGQIYCYY